MTKVALGAKAGNYDFNVADIRFKNLTDDPKISISDGELTLYDSKKDYVVLEGDFSFGGSYLQMIKRLDGVTVVEDGHQLYSASDLDLTKKDIGDDFNIKQWLAEQDFSIKGNAFGNTITAAGQNDFIHGMAGNDLLFGMDGADRLFGDDGNDTLDGGLGNDILNGGRGIDTFVFAAGDGADIVADFNARGRAHDLIDLSADEAVTAFADLALTQNGANVIVDLGDGDMLTLKHVKLANLDAGDFIF